LPRGTGVADGKECELSVANGCQAVAAIYAALKSAKEGGRAVALREIVATNAPRRA